MVDNSKTTDKIHETITQVGTAFVVKNVERRVTRVINQLISGNAYLNYIQFNGVQNRHKQAGGGKKEKMRR